MGAIMRMITQQLKNGKMNVLEVPHPSLTKGHLLIRNHYSLISAGTESDTVSAARKGYIGKAKERPEQVKQVLETLRAQGISQTYRAVMKKLDAYSSLGYSCVGEVMEVSSDVQNFQVCDLVACGGLTACHAEVVSVPVNLCVRLEKDADLKQAAYNTLGAIALQGVRQADLRLGETCAVIGLGLIGQLAALLLKASGVRVIGVDISGDMVDMAAKHCTDMALTRDGSGIEEKIMQFNGGIGCDAVILSAATDSLDPINFAGAISRKKGTVVVLGAVPTGFDRDPYYYRKELQVKMSCSYGPGRYDPAYEEKGIDYPAAYVRWTEKRNMQAFQDLIYTKKIDISYLTTHTFKLADAPQAYDMMMSKSESFVGIIIEYDTSKVLQSAPVKLKESEPDLRSHDVGIGFIGAGSYAQSNLLPNIPKLGRVKKIGVMTATSTGSRSVAERFGFDLCTGNEKDIIDNSTINTIFIATRHDTHAQYVVKALEAGKNVFVEKPLCLNEEELGRISEAYHFANAILMVGYNRRFSPLIKKVKDTFGSGPMSMIYRVNAGSIPTDSWIQDPEIGGGRIIGEVCHFVDLLTYINGSLPVALYANNLMTSNGLDDVVNITLTYANGSIGTIAYYANGDKGLAKERVEIYSLGRTAVINDFKEVAIYAGGKRSVKKLLSRDKGQKHEVDTFIRSITDRCDNPIPIEELFSTSLVTFAIIESLRSSLPVDIKGIS
jgi:polar amino acid transport system substrate-binding protein